MLNNAYYAHLVYSSILKIWGSVHISQTLDGQGQTFVENIGWVYPHLVGARSEENMLSFFCA